jgi:hypothetical protein
MTKIEPLRITFKSVQQAGLEILLEHYLQHLHYHSGAGIGHLRTITAILIAEWLLKVKQKNILEKAQATYTLTPQLRVALTTCLIDTASLHPLALSVHDYLVNFNEKSIRL